MPLPQLTGAGLGLRRSLIPALVSTQQPSAIDFLEVAPENWIKLGGLHRESFDELAERYPIVLHG